MKEAKCEACGFWTDGSELNCNYCGYALPSKEEALEKKVWYDEIQLSLSRVYDWWRNILKK